MMSMTQNVFNAAPALIVAAALAASPAMSQGSGFTQGTQPTPGVTPGLTPGGTAPNATVPNSNRAPTGTFATTGMGVFSNAPIDALQWRASDLIGQTVYNRANTQIGEVNELVVERDGRVSVAIIGLGGVMGLGQRNVAVNYQSIQTVADTNTKSMRLVLDIDQETLRNAPEFKRPDTWGRQ
jgi:sporulation protein YlmC with PRC-barrel domain